MNVLLLLGSVIGVAGLVLAAIVSAAGGARLRAVVLAVTGAAWVAGYGTLLLVSGSLSRQTILEPGEVKRFCGFYFDCHIGIAVLSDSVTPQIGLRRATGLFHIMMIEVSSDAVQATLTPKHLALHVVWDGRRREQDWVAAATFSGGKANWFIRPIPAGGAYRVKLVFDLPADIKEPALYANLRLLGVDRVLESVLIGDEDSFLHQKVLLALPPAAAAPASGQARGAARPASAASSARTPAT